MAQVTIYLPDSDCPPPTEKPRLHREPEVDDVAQAVVIFRAFLTAGGGEKGRQTPKLSPAGDNSVCARKLTTSASFRASCAISASSAARSPSPTSPLTSPCARRPRVPRQTPRPRRRSASAPC